LDVVGNAEINGTLTATSLSGAGGSVTGLSANNVSSGTLQVSRGGTGAGTLTVDKVLVGNGAGGVSTPTNLHWDSFYSFLGVRTATPSCPLDVVGNAKINGNLTASSLSGAGMFVTGLNANNVSSGTLTVSRGGTGADTLASGKVLVGSGTGAVSAPTNLHWDSTNSRLGIGTSTPSQALQVMGNAKINGDLEASGSLTGAQHFFRTATRSLSATLGSYIEMFSIRPYSGSATIWVDIVHDNNLSSMSRSYVITEKYRNVSLRLDCLPISSSGVYFGSEDVGLGVISSGATTKLVVIRRGGSDTNIFRMSIKVSSGEYAPSIVSSNEPEAVGWVADGIHDSTAISQVGGRLGVGTATPSAALDVIGDAIVSRELTADSLNVGDTTATAKVQIFMSDLAGYVQTTSPFQDESGLQIGGRTIQGHNLLVSVGQTKAAVWGSRDVEVVGGNLYLGAGNVRGEGNNGTQPSSLLAGHVYISAGHASNIARYPNVIEADAPYTVAGAIHFNTGSGVTNNNTDPVTQVRVTINHSGMQVNEALKVEGDSHIKDWSMNVTDRDANFHWKQGSTIRAYLGNQSVLKQLNFTGMHRCLVADCHKHCMEDHVGLIVVANANDYLSMDQGLTRGVDSIVIDECLPIVCIAHKRADKRVFGVVGTVEGEERRDTYGAFSTPFERPHGDNRAYINAVGEGAVWVCDEDGVFESGDLVISSTVHGYGTKQDDDVMRSCTVAKLTMDVDFQNTLVVKQRLRQETFEEEVDVMVEERAPDLKRVELRGSQYVRVTTPGELRKVPKRSMVQVCDENGDPDGSHEVTERETVTRLRNVLDGMGNAVWEDALAANGNVQIMEPRYKMRWLLSDGTQISEEDYARRRAAGETVHRAAFVGCTYHCG
jgi:hypothetical protein